LISPLANRNGPGGRFDGRVALIEMRLMREERIAANVIPLRGRRVDQRLKMLIVRYLRPTQINSNKINNFKKQN
jgi:hypothetical protein